MTTPFFRTDLLHATPLGFFHRHQGPGALGAGLIDGLIPQGIFAVGIAITGKKDFAIARFAPH